MSKLYELLAVERQHKAQADATRADLINTFGKKTHHFAEKTVVFKSDKEGAPDEVEEQLDLQTTVPKELRWISEFMIKALDCSYQVAEANTVARADVILENGKALLKQVPTTALLELDKRAAELREFISAIPTLDPAKGFQPDPDKGQYIFRARPEKRVRTKKVTKVLTLAPATDKHQATAEKYIEDVPVGTITTHEWSGLITTAQKGEMLARAEEFARAVRKARARANDIDQPKKDAVIGAAVVNYVFGF